MCIPLFFTANKEIHTSVINLATKLLLDETQNKKKNNENNNYNNNKNK